MSSQLHSSTSLRLEISRKSKVAKLGVPTREQAGFNKVGKGLIRVVEKLKILTEKILNRDSSVSTVTSLPTASLLNGV